MHTYTQTRIMFKALGFQTGFGLSITCEGCVCVCVHVVYVCVCVCVGSFPMSLALQGKVALLSALGFVNRG